MKIRIPRSLIMFVPGLPLVAAAVVFVPACNTTEGVGEDIEDLGGAIDDAAEDAND